MSWILCPTVCEVPKIMTWSCYIFFLFLIPVCAGSFWDPQSSQTLVLGTPSSPVTKMVPVGGRLWCGSQNRVLIINTTTLVQEVRMVWGMTMWITAFDLRPTDKLTVWSVCVCITPLPSHLSLPPFLLPSTGSRWALTAVGVWRAWWRTVRACGWRCRAVRRSNCTTLRPWRAWQRWTWRLLCTRCSQVSTHEKYMRKLWVHTQTCKYIHTW